MSKAVKRKRGDVAESTSRRTKLRKAARTGPIVRGDALKWKEVQLPDRLEDAEGFYGLEEIDDVELVKDEKGQITFRPKNVDDVIVGDGEVAGEEWDGFDDENNNGKLEDQHLNAAKSSALQSTSMNGLPSQNQKSTRKTQSKKEKKVANTSSSTSTSTSKPNPISSDLAEFEDELDFNALDDSEERTQADVTAWKELDLSPDVLSAISTLGFSDPTPIQKAAIPPIRDGHDVIGKAVTGSGKTLAFGIPIIERWLEMNIDRSKDDASIPTAFILAPTRELAHQLSKHLAALARSLDPSPRIATVTGGLALVKQQRQIESADIIVGTPGRMWEVINSSHGLVDRLKQVRFLVIDEADRLLSEGHFKEVEEILDVLDRKVIEDTAGGNEQDDQVFTAKAVKTDQRQTLVFSATFHKGLQQKLATKQKWRPEDSNLLTNTQSLDYLLRKIRFQRGVKPTFVDANPASSMAERLSESVLECGAMQKDLYIYSLLLQQQHEHTKQLRLKTNADNGTNITRTLVFTNSISTVKRLVPLLSALSIPNTSILPLHSSMPQKSRLRSLERFTTPPNSSDTTVVLVATDVAARGLDIKGVDTIVHYHVPRTADMYVHRSGRTARASSSGRSILICSPDEVAGVTRLISKVHQDQNKTNQPTKKNIIQSLYLPASLPTQLSKRVSLAQKITDTTMSTSQVKTEDSWLRNAAEELGVDYSSDEYEAISKRGRRGRGGGRDAKKKDAVEQSRSGSVAVWKDELKAEMKNRRIDFGDGSGVRGKYLAGGAVDVERLLREGV